MILFARVGVLIPLLINDTLQSYCLFLVSASKTIICHRVWLFFFVNKRLPCRLSYLESGSLYLYKLLSVFLQQTSAGDIKTILPIVETDAAEKTCMYIFLLMSYKHVLCHICYNLVIYYILNY